MESPLPPLSSPHDRPQSFPNPPPKPQEIRRASARANQTIPSRVFRPRRAALPGTQVQKESHKYLAYPKPCRCSWLTTTGVKSPFSTLRGAGNGDVDLIGNIHVMMARI